MENQKSHLQVRAEEIYARSRKNLRKPIVIEFSGCPKAGKTTVLGQVQAFLKRIGFRTQIVVERASVCPIRDKRHSNFNIWTACTTLAELLEKTQDPPRQDDPEILILDRGLFDSIAWLRMMENLARLRVLEREVIEKFLSMGDWRRRITGVVVMTAEPKDSMKRERGQLPVIETGGQSAGGSIMNEDVLGRFKATVERVAKENETLFPIHIVNTSSPGLVNKLDKVCETVAEKVLDWIDAQVQERILTIPRTRAQKIFEGNTWLDPKGAEVLVSEFMTSGKYLPRDDVEKDSLLVQALPIVIIRNKLGHVLRLRRRERDKENYLNEKLVNWAGGHVREEDSTNGDPLLACAVRELNEELRLRITKEELKFVGATYFENYGEGTAKHIAIAYEWIAKTEDVSVVLSTAEFFERTGGSLSGKFVAVQDLEQSDSSGKTEPWTLALYKNHLATGGVRQNGLFQ